jgi:hypothetical protein
MSMAGCLLTCSSCALQEPCRIPAKSFMDCLEANNGVDCFHCSCQQCMLWRHHAQCFSS